jgi:hypothetical protein
MNKGKVLLHAAALFLFFLPVYWLAIPPAFNSVYENRRFFDSDGEFIVRQYRQGKTYTHNDHLLYHVAAGWVQRGSERLPAALHVDALTVHKAFSAAAGALGVALLYLFGRCLSAGAGTALAAAAALGGCAGWLFFSSTVDTYMPCLAACIAALGTALLYPGAPSPRRAAALGACMGLAFLLRTDSILLAPLGLVVLAAGNRRAGAAAALVAAGLVVAAAGYAILAHTVYDVPFARLADWAIGSMSRPEAQVESVWGRSGNLTPGHLRLALTNQALYSVLMPNVLLTRDANFFRIYSGWGWLTLVAYLVLAAAAGLLWTGRARKACRQRDWAGVAPYALALAWVLPRTVFYAWWDPHDPFLFAVMSLPAIWMILLYGRLAVPASWGRRADWALAALALGIWIHNAWFLLRPLNQGQG